MKLLYICHEPIPSASTNTEQVMKAAAAMAGLGVRVVVSTSTREDASPGELADRAASFYGLPRDLFDDTLSLLPLPAPTPVRGDLTKPWHDIRAARAGASGDFDVLYTRDPIPLAAGLATGAPVAFETYRYDLNSRASWAPWRAFCYGRPNLLGVVTHSGLARESFARRGFSDDRLLVAHNGYEAPPGGVPQRDEARRRVGIETDAPVVVYAGGVVPSKGVDSILPVAEALSEVQVFVVGHEPGSPGHAWLQERIDSGGHGNVRMVPRVPPSEVVDYLAAADCLFIPTVSGPLYDSGRTVLPMKTFRYLGAGRPIVAPDLPDLREVLRSDENALLVAPDHPPATVSAVRRVLEDEGLAARLAQGARETAEGLDWSTRARRIRDFLTDHLRAR